MFFPLSYKIMNAQAAWASAFKKAEQNNRLVCTDFRKFLIICEQIISLESSTPPYVQVRRSVLHFQNYENQSYGLIF